jgi:hypothetical protein
MTARIVEHEKVATARQQCDKDVSVATNKHAKIENCWKLHFIFGPCQDLYSKDPA